MIEIRLGIRLHDVELWDPLDRRLLIIRRRDMPRLALRLLLAWLLRQPRP